MSKKPATYNIQSLLEDQLQMYRDLRDGKIEIKDAAERNNTAGKVFGGIKLQLAYAEARKETPDIGFMNKEEEVQQ